MHRGGVNVVIDELVVKPHTLSVVGVNLQAPFDCLSIAERDGQQGSKIADTVAEIVLEAKGSPVSIGVSGEWGVGKSSMIRLIRRSLRLV